MNCAIIDIGSNSMRLTVYEVESSNFKILFKAKAMAGLAGYVENNQLTTEGIECACHCLLEFHDTLKLLHIEQVSVFATASLRNIANTQAAVAQISTASGYAIEVLSGAEEATYGYSGAMCDLAMTDGIFIDIGGASTEIAVFSAGHLNNAESIPIGSLKLYHDCVKKILPGKGSFARMQEQIDGQLRNCSFVESAANARLACVGGTARAVLKLARKCFSLPATCRSITAEQLDALCNMLYKVDKTAIDLILKTEPERIHTLLPGLMILQYIVKKFAAAELVISKYGVREGYLCQRIQSVI